MAISKTSQYSAETLRSAVIYHALAHPARLTITDLVLKSESLTNKDLSSILKLSESTVHFHLKKLVAAGLIEVEFQPNIGLLKRGRSLTGSFSDTI